MICLMESNCRALCPVKLPARDFLHLAHHIRVLISVSAGPLESNVFFLQKHLLENPYSYDQ
jgi:hypothetical protein